MVPALCTSPVTTLPPREQAMPEVALPFPSKAPIPTARAHPIAIPPPNRRCICIWARPVWTRRRRVLVDAMRAVLLVDARRAVLLVDVRLLADEFIEAHIKPWWVG